MKKYCCFAGHGQYAYSHTTKETLASAVKSIIKDYGITEFMVGNYGDFDRLCASVLRGMKQEFPQIKILLTVPYLTKSVQQKANDFDEIIIPEFPESTPRNLKIIKCNEFMVDNSRVLICYVTCDFGGAVKTLEYAESKNRGKDEPEINIYHID